MAFAIGTETWGSIVSPSTRCGTTGLRPTYGRVSRAGAMALSWTMDKIGPICRTVEDCAVVFDAIRGTDNIDMSLIDASFNYVPDIDLKDLKIGYLKEDFENDTSFADQNDATLEKLRELGADLIEIKLPDLPIKIRKNKLAKARINRILTNQRSLNEENRSKHTQPKSPICA